MTKTTHEEAPGVPSPEPQQPPQPPQSQEASDLLAQQALATFWSDLDAYAVSKHRSCFTVGEARALYEVFGQGTQPTEKAGEREAEG